MTAQPWTRTLERRDADGFPEWTLACAHGSVTTEEVKRTYSADEAIDLYRSLTAASPDTSERERTMTAIRMLLGRLLTERAGCRCAEIPFAVVSRGAVQWTVDQ